MSIRDKATDWELNRRQLVRGLGGAAVVGLAGCTEGNPGTPTETDEGGDTPTSEETETDEVQMGGELIATFGADVANYDPTQINDTTSSKAFGLVYETLLDTDFEGQPQPYLAESFEQLDDATFEATLREGVTFHDGSDLTAEDVQASFERYEGTPRESDVYLWYEDSEIVDDLTIEINLSRPYAPLEYDLGGVPIVPAEAAEGDLDLTEDPIGTGPYVFEEHKPDDLFRIVRNDDYWFEGGDGMPEQAPIETLTFRVIVEQSAQQAALESGDVDLINNPPAQSVSQFEENDQFTVTKRVSGGFDMFIYPMHPEADTPWQNRQVRLGTNRLIPREAIVETVYDGIGQPAYAPISPLAEQFTSEEFQQEMGDEFSRYDPDQAAELLEQGFQEAGFDKPYQTTIVTNENPQRVQWSQLIQESMNQTEFFDIGLEQFEWNTYVGKVLSEDSHTMDQLVALGWSAGWDPDAYVNFLFHGDQVTPNCCNINHYNQEEINSLIEEGLETYEVEARQEIYEELQRKIVEQSPMAFIRFGNQFNVMEAETVRNFATYPIDGDEYASIYAPYAGKYTWVDK